MKHNKVTILRKTGRATKTGLKIASAKASSAKAHFSAKLTSKGSKKVVKNGKPITGAMKGAKDSYKNAKLVPGKTKSFYSGKAPKSGKKDNTDKRLGAYMQSIKTAY